MTTEEWNKENRDSNGKRINKQSTQIKTHACNHESVLTADGNGAYCKHCGETLE